MTTLQNLLSYYRVGETVTLTVEMPGKDGSYEEKEVEVVLSEKQTETAIPKRQEKKIIKKSILQKTKTFP